MKPLNIPIKMEISSIHHPDRRLDGSLVHPELVPQIPEHLLTKEDREAYERYKTQKEG